MDVATTCLLTFAIMVLMAVLCVIVVAVAAFVCMTAWALVKPHLSGLIDAWIDWFERRTGC